MDPWQFVDSGRVQTDPSRNIEMEIEMDNDTLVQGLRWLLLLIEFFFSLIIYQNY